MSAKSEKHQKDLFIVEIDQRYFDADQNCEFTL